MPGIALTAGTAPVGAILDLAAVKAHLGIPDGDQDDALLTDFIAAVTERLDGWGGELGRAVRTLDVTESFDQFPASSAACLELRLPPVAAVESVKYDDEDGAERTLAADRWRLDLVDGAGYLAAPTGTYWPQAALVPDSVRVRYTAGNGASIADGIRIAARMMVYTLYEYRTEDFVGRMARATENPAVRRLLDQHRYRWPVA